MATEDREQAEARFRARRRLLKLGVYMAPTLLSLTALLGQSEAQVKVKVKVKVKVSVPVGAPG